MYSALLRISEQHLYGSSCIGMRTPEAEMIGAQLPDDQGLFAHSHNPPSPGSLRYYPITPLSYYQCTQAVWPRICSRAAHFPPRTWPSLRKMNKARTQMLGWSGLGTRDTGLGTRDSGLGKPGARQSAICTLA